VGFHGSPLWDTALVRIQDARLYFICGIDRLAALEPALRGGVDVFQLRDKHAADGELLRAAETARALCTRHGALFVVNDRPDLAVAADADGVHLGQDDMPVEQARAIVGPELLIGRSTHSPGQVDGAGGADYIGVGPIHATPTKLGRPAVGLDLVRYAAAHAAVPFFAIGGIDHTNIGTVVGAGAARAAVVRAIGESADPEASARELRAALAVPVG
jgi:thiamine-phosphate pyrophosphorylase